MPSLSPSACHGRVKLRVVAARVKSTRALHVGWRGDGRIVRQVELQTAAGRGVDEMDEKFVGGGAGVERFASGAQKDLVSGCDIPQDHEHRKRREPGRERSPN